jgi:acyl CoA:acetate/3-ketoacid CoA transferase beta subunit
MSPADYTSDEIMTVTAARQLRNGAVCFVGIGLPSAACNLARMTHAPDLVLIYESGTVGTRPTVLPLSIGDSELAETAAAVIPLPEIFTHYLQRGRVDVGFLGAAQIDRYGNLNSTVIGDYAHPTVRLPGAGGCAGDCDSCPRGAGHHQTVAAHFRATVGLSHFVWLPGGKWGAARRVVPWTRPAGGDNRLRCVTPTP